MTSTNYFSDESVADRYCKGRPDFHAHAIDRISKFINLQGKLDSALDIACGTGLSTKPLLSVANNVYGTDSSIHMLDQASERGKITYLLAPAEKQPFDNESFDIITVCSGVHWFHIEKFLAEANRLLKRNGWLVLYDNFFISEMAGNEQFKDWFPNVYLKKFPSPPRNDKYHWTNDNLTKMNLNFVAEEKFKNPVIFNKSQLKLYFTTQSNIISKVETRETTYEAAEHWLDKELSAFFTSDDEVRTINFGNWMKFIQRMG
jgi:ubiquinone/menaquinone biosynthesis C-methylase UbiE